MSVTDYSLEATTGGTTLRVGGALIINNTVPVAQNNVRSVDSISVTAQSESTVNLATFCTTLKAFWVKPAAPVGLGIKRTSGGTAPTGTGATYPGDGFLQLKELFYIDWDTAVAPPVLVIQNAHATDAATVEIGIIGAL